MICWEGSREKGCWEKAVPSRRCFPLSYGHDYRAANTPEPTSGLATSEGFSIPDTATSIHDITNQVVTQKGISLERELRELLHQIEQADIIVGHHIYFNISLLLAEARLTVSFELKAALTHHKFGFDAGRRAAICT